MQLPCGYDSQAAHPGAEPMAQRSCSRLLWPPLPLAWGERALCTPYYVCLLHRSYKAPLFVALSMRSICMRLLCSLFKIPAADFAVRSIVCHIPPEFALLYRKMLKYRC